MFVLILDILFFINKKISFRKKAVYSAVILIFFISFENSFINQIWHGLSKNHCFNYRYSFLLSFVLLLIAWETCQVLKEELPPKEDLLKAVLILGVILAFVIQNASDKINILGISGYSFDPDIYNRIFSEESAGKKSHGSHFVLRRRSFSGMQRIFLPERHPHAVLQYLWNQ